MSLAISKPGGISDVLLVSLFYFGDEILALLLLFRASRLDVRDGCWDPEDIEAGEKRKREGRGLTGSVGGATVGILGQE